MIETKKIPNGPLTPNCPRRIPTLAAKIQLTNMTTIEDTQDDEVIEEIEQAKLESKREKTEYGSLLNDDE